MVVVTADIFELHTQIKTILKEFQWHTEFGDRLSLLKSSKKTVAKYLKVSREMDKVLRANPNPTHNLKTYFERYSQGMNRDAQIIISIYLKYGYSCNKEHSEKFQAEFSALHRLLKHRIDVEEYYLLPEVKLIQKRQMTFTKSADFERGHTNLEITQPL